MRAPHHEPPRYLGRVLRWLFRGPRGAEAYHELKQEYTIVRERHIGLVAWLWYVGQLFRPSTWVLARELRSARRDGHVEAGIPLKTSWPRLGVSWLDVKLGLRMLVKYPGLTVVTVFALSIAIPVGLAPWLFVNVVQAPLPVDEGDRILVLRNFNVATSNREASSWQDFVQWRDELTTFEAVGAATRGLSDFHNVVTEDGRAAPVRGAEVTASTFDILRVPPLIGRTLLPADEVMGAPDVVVIGSDLWQSRFGGDPDVIGRTIRIGRVPHTVVGVMPEDFLFPARNQLWLPVRMNMLADERGQWGDHVIFGRLAAGISSEEAQAELATVGRRMAIEFPDTHARLEAQVVPFAIGFIGLPKGGFRSRPEFYLFQVLALLLLAAACANVGMLIFTRTATRSGELAVRTALGASRARVISQLFIETLVLAVLAAGAGLLFADLILSRVGGVIVGGERLMDVLPFWIDLGMSRGTVIWALSLAVLSAVVAGVLPAVRVTGRAVQQNIQRATAGRTGVRFGGLSSVLIVADVALAMVSVGAVVGVSSGLLIGNRIGMGFEGEQFLSVELRIPQIESDADGAQSDPIGLGERVGAVQEALVRRLAAEPDIRGVTMATRLPRMGHSSRRVELSGEDRSSHQVRITQVDANFFDAFEQPILNGRGFDFTDLGEDRSAVIVNTSFVDSVLAGRNPIGRQVRYMTSADEDPGPWFEIVGVVGDLGMGLGSREGLYHPLAPGDINPVHLAIHVGDDPESFIPRLRALAAEVDPAAIIASPVALNKVTSDESFANLAIIWGGGLLAGILLWLAASSIYALMSFAVGERTREIGIRTALGAQRSSIALAIAGRAVAQLGVGVLLGMVGLILAGTQLASPPLGVTLVQGVGVMVVIGMLACTAPTLRALRITPTEALREGG